MKRQKAKFPKPRSSIWQILLIFALAVTLMTFLFLLSEPETDVKAERLKSISIRSGRIANYSADVVRQVLPPLKMELVHQVISQGKTSFSLESKFNKIIAGLESAVPTVTPPPGFAPTHAPASPTNTPTHKPLRPSPTPTLTRTATPARTKFVQPPTATSTPGDEKPTKTHQPDPTKTPLPPLTQTSAPTRIPPTNIPPTSTRVNPTQEPAKTATTTAGSPRSTKKPKPKPTKTPKVDLPRVTGYPIYDLWLFLNSPYFEGVTTTE